MSDKTNEGEKNETKQEALKQTNACKDTAIKRCSNADPREKGDT